MRGTRFFLVVCGIAALLAGGPAVAAAATAWSTTAPPDAPALSYGFVGMYRKTLEVEDEIQRYAVAYGIDPVLARAVCLYESGGNGSLTSAAGAHGYFQVMPATFRLLGVSTNIEAGIKYLAQLQDRFGREDLALAAYNGGPAHVLRQRPMRMETLQYVVGIAYYKNILHEHEPAVRAAAERLRLLTVEEGETWWSVSQRTGLPILTLRMFNPFLASRELQAGQLVAVPPEPPPYPVEEHGEALSYVTRLGDIYLNLAFIFGLEPDQLRQANGLWHVDQLLPGTTLTIPLDREVEWRVFEVQDGESLGDLAARTGLSEWALIRDNRLWDQDLHGLREVRGDPSAKVPPYVLYTVRSGDTLSAIAGRHGVSLSELRRVNDLPSSYWRIRAGQVLRVPRS